MRISLFICMFMMPIIWLAAQEIPGYVYLHADELDNGGTKVLGEELWRYHPGDDTTWANGDLNDADWEFLKPDFDLDSIDPGTWNGIGWFRIRLIIDSALHNSTLALHPFHQGASELYLNGRLIGGYGTIGKDDSSTKYFNPKGLPIGLHLGGQDTSIMTVRYAHHVNTPIAKALENHPRHPRGFFFLLKPIDRGVEAFFFRTLEVPFTLGFTIGIFLLLGILHIFLFVLDRREKANLYFFILAITGCVAVYIVAAYDSPALIIPDFS